MNKAEQFWDGRAESFDGRGESELQANPGTLIAIARHLKPDDVVLDFGCATGTWSLALARTVKEIHGLDISGKMVGIAQTKAAALQVENAWFSQGSIFDDQYLDESFDVILGLNVLHLLDDTPQAMDRIYRLLKRGGRFISETPCLGQNRSLMTLFMHFLSKTGIVPHLRIMTSEDVKRLMTEAGMDIVELDIQSGTTAIVFAVAEKN